MEKYIINDTIVEYECIGERTPMLFLHGWGMDKRIMSGCFEPVFEGKTLCYKRIYIVLPGMGKSVAGKGINSSDDMLDVIYHFVKEVIVLSHKFNICILKQRKKLSEKVDGQQNRSLRNH